MLFGLSLFLIAIGAVLNRLSNRYFRRHREHFSRAPDERMLQDVGWVAWLRWPPVVSALFGYFLGLLLVLYGLANLLG